MRAFALLLAGCADPDGAGLPRPGLVPGDPVDPGSIPLSGRGLAAEGTTAAACDVDGDRVLWFDLETGSTRQVRFPAGWAPSAVALDEGRTAVVLRGARRVAVFDEDLRVEVSTVCSEPRGIDARDGKVAVACAGGELAVLGGPTHHLEVDLGDVVLDGDVAWVGVVREAVVLRVALADGEVLDRFPLPPPADLHGVSFASRAIRRLARVGDGRVAALHQAHATSEVVLDPDAGFAYGSGACEAVARPVITWIGDEGPQDTVRLDAILPIDLTFWAEGDGAFTEPTPVVAAVLAGPAPGVAAAYPPSGLADPDLYCVPRGGLLEVDGYVSGVAWSDLGPLVVTRYPFSVVGGDGPLAEDLEAAGPDPGFALFHDPTPSGLACATCHVDGREDGHVWRFAGVGPRRTQTLSYGPASGPDGAEPTGSAGGLLATAPYHWDGDLADLPALFADTGVDRMGHAPRPAAEVEALGRWLDALPAPVPARDRAAEGAELYRGACARCHDPVVAEGADVGTGGRFQIPSLVGVGARLPLMHDGCARTLAERFDPSCGGDRHGPELDAAEVDALVAHLESL